MNSDNQWKKKIRQWGLKKNFKKTEYKAMVRKKNQRGPGTEIGSKLSGKEVRPEKLARFEKIFDTQVSSPLTDGGGMDSCTCKSQCTDPKLLVTPHGLECISPTSETIESPGEIWSRSPMQDSPPRPHTVGNQSYVGSGNLSITTNQSEKNTGSNGQQHADYGNAHQQSLVPSDFPVVNPPFSNDENEGDIASFPGRIDRSCCCLACSVHLQPNAPPGALAFLNRWHILLRTKRTSFEPA